MSGAHTGLLQQTASAQQRLPSRGERQHMVICCVHELCRSDAPSAALSFCCSITLRLAGCLAIWLQVYAVCLELINMYENYRVPISQEECRRLLAVVRPPHPAPAAAAATPPQQ